MTVPRSDWSKVATAFRRFFDGLGDVVVDDDHARFVAGDTSLELRVDGSSSSFMPLHTANLRWEQVTFDPSDQSVTLTDGRSAYAYRVPPHLVRARKGSAEAS